MKRLGVILFLFCVAFYANAQIESIEDELKAHFDLLVNEKSDSSKVEICERIEQSFLKILAEDRSFNYPFRKLNRMGKITSPDFNFRIYNWNCVLSDGSYKYFGIIQYKNKSGIKVQALNDNEGDANMFSSYSSSNWPGALYYEIIPFKSKGSKKYVVLGWDGNNMSTNKKIIEIISFEKSGIVFGKPIISWRGKNLNRVIFEYAKQARMSIDYQAKKKRLVFDHLAPSSPNYQNQFEYYGPDFTHDALLLKGGMWILEENVDVRKQ